MAKPRQRSGEKAPGSRRPHTEAGHKGSLEIRDRIVELRRVPASALRANPANWRRHPQYQRQAMTDVLSELGFAGAVLAYEHDGALELIDGHLRAELAGAAEVPVLVLDVTPEEARKLLVTLDPLSMMAQPDMDALTELLNSTAFSSEAINDMMEAIVNGETRPLPDYHAELGPELDEGLADGISLCTCPQCGHEHHKSIK